MRVLSLACKCPPLTVRSCAHTSVQVHRETERSWSLSLTTPTILLDQDFTFVPSFNLNYLLNVLSLSASHWESGLQGMDLVGGTIQFRAKRHPARRLAESAHICFSLREGKGSRTEERKEVCQDTDCSLT